MYAIADEDLERETEEKTSSVHFLRFELDEMARALKGGSPLAIGVDHPQYRAALEPLRRDPTSLFADSPMNWTSVRLMGPVFLALKAGTDEKLT